MGLFDPPNTYSVTSRPFGKVYRLRDHIKHEGLAFLQPARLVLLGLPLRANPDVRRCSFHPFSPAYGPGFLKILCVIFGKGVLEFGILSPHPYPHPLSGLRKWLHGDPWLARPAITWPFSTKNVVAVTLL